MGAEFVSRLDAGDLRGAATWLVHSHGSDVFALCQAMVRDHAVAEDLAQDTFSRAFAGLATYRGDASPRSWLLTIAKNRCIDHLRREKARPWLLEDDPLAEVAAFVDDAPLAPDLASDRELVEAGMRVLDEQQRALVVLRFQHGMAYSELAHAFGVKAGTVRMRVSRALAKMRFAIGSDGERLDSKTAGGGAARPQGAPAPGAVPAAPFAPPSRSAPAKSRGGLLGRLSDKRTSARARASAAPGGAPPSPPPRGSAEAFAATLRSLGGPLSQGLAFRLDQLVEGLGA